MSASKGKEVRKPKLLGVFGRSLSNRNADICRSFGDTGADAVVLLFFHLLLCYSFTKQMKSTNKQTNIPRQYPRQNEREKKNKHDGGTKYLSDR